MVKFEVGELAVYQTKNQFLIRKNTINNKKTETTGHTKIRVWYNHKYKTTIVPYLNI